MKVNLLQGNVRRIFFILLLSAIGSSIVSTIYSTVDLVCVGQYHGELGAAAISCVNPMWPLMISVGYMAGVGGSVMMSNRRGVGDRRSGNEYFTLSVVFSLVWSAIVVLLLVFFEDELLRTFGASDPDVLKLAKEYMKSIIFVAPSFTMCGCLATFMRNDGEAVIPTVATIIGGVINMVLDVLLVFDFGAGLGIFGAGLATAIGQAAAFLIICGYFFTKKCNLRVSVVTKIPRKLYRIVTVGFSAFLLEVSFGVTAVSFNSIIAEHLSSVHMAVFGTASTVVALFCCLLNGVGTALQPIVASNFGANQHTRVKKTLNLAMIVAGALSVCFFAFIMLAPEFIIKLYIDTTDTPELLEIGARVLRIYGGAMPVVGITIVASFYFQSVLKQPISILIALLRGLLLPIALVWALPYAFGDFEIVWWSMPISEAAAFAVAVAALVLCARRTKKIVASDGTPPSDVTEPSLQAPGRVKN